MSRRSASTSRHRRSGVPGSRGRGGRGTSPLTPDLGPSRGTRHLPGRAVPRANWGAACAVAARAQRAKPDGPARGIEMKSWVTLRALKHRDTTSARRRRAKQETATPASASNPPPRQVDARSGADIVRDRRPRDGKDRLNASRSLPIVADDLPRPRSGTGGETFRAAPMSPGASSVGLHQDYLAESNPRARACGDKPRRGEYHGPGLASIAFVRGGRSAAPEILATLPAAPILPRHPPRAERPPHPGDYGIRTGHPVERGVGDDRIELGVERKRVAVEHPGIEAQTPRRRHLLGTGVDSDDAPASRCDRGGKRPVAATEIENFVVGPGRKQFDQRSGQIGHERPAWKATDPALWPAGTRLAFRRSICGAPPSFRLLNQCRAGRSDDPPG